MDNNAIEQLKRYSSYENFPLIKDKYRMFEWAPVIPILDDTQEEAPDIIN